jgi:L-2-hydroxyglutarate oxidase LhgO
VGEDRLDGKAFDVGFVGGGLVGLSSARAYLARRPRARVVLLEKEPALARHQSGRNSGVVHSGIHYPPGSRKARLCVEGARELAEYCAERGIRLERRGKVVVATAQSEVARLQQLLDRGIANGVSGLELVGAERLKEIEPHAAGVAALHCPATAVVDFGEVARALAADLEAAGGSVRTGARVRGLRRVGGEWALETSAGRVLCRSLVNCAGLHSDRVARMAGASPGVRIVPFRGQYYALRPDRRHLVRSLVYPAPDPAFPFLGVHLTRTIRDEVEAGPNAVLALSREAYRVWQVSPRDLAEVLLYRGFWAFLLRHRGVAMEEIVRSRSRRAFAAVASRLVPEIRAEDLRRAGSGVRAQAMARDGTLLDDFRIEGNTHAVHVLNAPSPAATACLAIGRHVAELAAEAFGSGE